MSLGAGQYYPIEVDYRDNLDRFKVVLGLPTTGTNTVAGTTITPVPITKLPASKAHKVAGRAGRLNDGPAARRD